MISRESIAECVRFVFCLVALLAIFVLLLVLKRHIAPAQVIYYEAGGVVVAGMLTGLALGVPLVASGRLRKLVSATSLFAACIAYLFAAELFVTNIALLERSISIFTVAVVEQSGSDGVTRDELDRAFQSAYLVRTDALGKRLSEQVLTGNVQLHAGRYRATSRGQLLAEMSRRLATLFNIPRGCVDPAG